MSEEVTRTKTRYTCSVCGTTSKVYAIVEAQWNGTHWVGVGNDDPTSIRCENHGDKSLGECVVELKEVSTRRNMV